RGWCLGSEEFRKELLAAASERVGLSHFGAGRQQTGEEKANRLVAQSLGDLGWDEKELQNRRKGDESKVAMARLLRKDTTMSLKWIANRLEMGSWTYVFNLLNAKAPQNQSCVNSED